MNIYNVPKEKRYWVVRAEAGIFYDHFIKYGLIALGHIDELFLPECKERPFYPEFSDLESKLKKLHGSKELKKRRTSAHINQIKSFLYEMNVGDWVITVGEYSLSFGRITGHPRLDRTPLPILHETGTERRIDLNYNLRRNVSWGPRIHRNNLPFGLLQSLRANQTLFNIDHHLEAIYHTLYPAFTFDDKLYLSARINARNGISNYDITSLLSILNEIEVIAKEIENGISSTNFDDFFKKYVTEDKLTIKTKAQFYSPGDIWNTVSSIAGNLDSWGIYTILAYSMLFGNQKLGFDGLIDLTTRQKIWDIVLGRIQKKNIGAAIDRLQLTTPALDTSKLEQQTLDEKQL